MSRMDSLPATIRASLRTAADPVRAPGMQAYMKSAMPYHGVAMPTLRKLVKAAVKADPPDSVAEAEGLVLELWDHAQFREERYAAGMIADLPVANGRLELVELHEHMALTGAWWDHVDPISHRIAALHDAHPEQTAAIVRDWSTDDDMWLRRLAIISQLGRKDRLDPALLTDVIEPNTDDREFFIRKAIGWALREYARIEPDWVRDFVAEREDVLSGLTKREALKHVA